MTKSAFAFTILLMCCACTTQVQSITPEGILKLIIVYHFLCNLFVIQFECNKVEALIRSWSPLIWLHSEELFYPSSVDFFLPEITVQDDQGIIYQEFATTSNLIGGDNTSSLHMQTRQPLGIKIIVSYSFKTQFIINDNLYIRMQHLL